MWKQSCAHIIAEGLWEAPHSLYPSTTSGNQQCQPWAFLNYVIEQRLDSTKIFENSACVMVST